jgi:hypothetical protein
MGDAGLVEPAILGTSGFLLPGISKTPALWSWLAAPITSTPD